MAPLRMIIFDVDGTLIDSQAHIMAAMGQAFTALGLSVPARDVVLAQVGISLPQMMPRLAPEQSSETHHALVEAYKDSFADLRLADGAALSPFFPGMRQVLDDLLAAPEPLVGIATGKSRRGLDHLLDLHGLAGAFATEQVADHHPSKPHPSMLLTALAETGVDAADAVMVGDTSYDIEMGRAAGVATIGVSWGYHPVAELEQAGADQIVTDIAALPAALTNVWGQTA